MADPQQENPAPEGRQPLNPWQWEMERRRQAHQAEMRERQERFQQEQQRRREQFEQERLLRQEQFAQRRRPQEQVPENDQAQQEDRAIRDQMAAKLEELRAEALKDATSVSRYLSALDSVLSRNISPIFNLGVVVDAYPFARIYRVASGGGAVHVCRPLLRGSSSLTGVADASTYPPGTLVWYFVPPGSVYGIILGADPTYGTGYNALNDIIFQGSSVGFFADTSFQKPFTGNRRSLGAADFSGRSPEDLLESGEFCRISETGTMLFLDSYMAVMRASEICGIWLFYLDHLLRIFGNNLQIWSGISQEEFYNDEGEAFYYRGLVFYPWEQLGILRPKDDKTIFISHTLGDTRNLPGYTRYMPKDTGIKPFHRFRTYGGYISGGVKETVYVPTDQQINFHNPKQHNPEVLLDILKTVDGQFGVRAAKSIHFVKTPVIHWPERVRRMEDLDGDKPPDYEPSVGGHDLINNIAIRYSRSMPDAVAAETYPTAQEAEFARLFRWLGESGFYYHKKDFKVTPPRMRVISRRHAKRTPQSDPESHDGVPPMQIQINRPEGIYTYYDTTASISLNEDSSISLIDGWNSSIRMTNDRIYIDTRTLVLNCEKIVMPCPTLFPDDEAYITVREQYIPDRYLMEVGIYEVWKMTAPMDALSANVESLAQNGLTVSVQRRVLTNNNEE